MLLLFVYNKMCYFCEKLKRKIAETVTNVI